MWVYDFFQEQFFERLHVLDADIGATNTTREKI